MLRNKGNGILTIDSIKDLSAEDAKKLSAKYTKIQILSQGFGYGTKNTNYVGYYQQDPYDVNEFIACREKLDELIEKIDPNSSDLEKFSEIYYRVCQNIEYDYPAGYPDTRIQEEYSRLNKFRSRDLRNGLLDGKAICSGYAYILKSALELVGIDAVYVCGPVNEDLKKQKNFLNYYRNLKKDSPLKKILEKRANNSYKEYNEAEWHAWNKVKIDGVWYNCDPTWDRENISVGKSPEFVLKSDKNFEKDGKYCENGPECKNNFSKNKIKSTFKKIFNKYEINLLPKSKKSKENNNSFRDNISIDESLDFEKTIIRDKKYREDFEKDAGYTISELVKMGFTPDEIIGLSPKILNRPGRIRAAIEHKQREKNKTNKTRQDGKDDFDEER